ncbi:Retrovirus-related Pol polyprotein from transposon opus [Dictyocoela muelleri]|nr:Retrovirus-related Pol polyprotein from transposon opus [Dictyocoela muelleri]
MIDNMVKIDFENNFLSINGTELELGIEKETENVSEVVSIKINKLIERYKSKINFNNNIIGKNFKIETITKDPIFQREYEVPIKYKYLLRNNIDKLEKQGTILKSESIYNSPAFIIPKTNNDMRLVIDYRKLNLITKSINYPFPKIQSILTDLNNAKIFSTLDLEMGYYQISVDKDSVQKTAFSVMIRKY